MVFLAASASAQIRGEPELVQALGRLAFTGSVLHTGAHPDDEHSSLLAYLARGRLVRTAYLSATRGDGGQNLLGTEQYEAMGLLRTEELLAARRLDGAEQFFTRAMDFGFSKSMEETLEKWGHERTLGDFVRILREFRPDVVIARFSGTPQDGHGHHQASGLLTREAFRAAADSNRFPEQLREGLRPWQARKYYTTVNRFGPAANQPLPSGTLELDVGDYDAVLGASYNQIGIEGRVLHRSQGQGGFVPRPGPARTGLLLRESVLEKRSPEKDLFDGVTITLDRYTELGAPPSDVAALSHSVLEAVEKFRGERPEEIIPLLARGLGQVRRMLSNAGSNDELRFLLSIKEKEFSRALELAQGLALEALAGRAEITPGSRVDVTVTVWNRARETLLKALDVTLEAPAGWTVEAAAWQATEVAYNRSAARRFMVTVPPGAAPSQPYWLSAPREGDFFAVSNPQWIGLPHSPPLLVARVRWSASGVEVASSEPVVYRHSDAIYGQRGFGLNVLPAVAAWTEPSVVIFPGPNQDREIKVRLRSNSNNPVSDRFSLAVPPGWTATPKEQKFDLSKAGQEATYTFSVKAAAAPKQAVATIAPPYSVGYQLIDYPHIRPQYWFRPAETTLDLVDLKIAPKLRVGYIMGAGDEVPAALRQLGATVTLLETEEVLSGDLAPYHAIVIGVRAYAVRPGLVAANPRLLEYVRQGGVLIVQYQIAPNGGFPYGPFPMEQGRPAARVTVEDAPVELLAPDHPLLAKPNRITAADFEGWIQERGLYFMSQWAREYTPLLACHDPGESPQRGGMLVAPLGKGLYVYTAYAWFRQLPAGVPGAYRFWANLLSWGK